MDKKLAKQYYNRWRQVAQIEHQEQQAASLQQRWIQLNSLWRLAVGLNLLPVTDKTLVWQRWARLKREMQ